MMNNKISVSKEFGDQNNKTVKLDVIDRCFKILDLHINTKLSSLYEGQDIRFLRFYTKPKYWSRETTFDLGISNGNFVIYYNGTTKIIRPFKESDNLSLSIDCYNIGNKCYLDVYNSVDLKEILCCFEFHSKVKYCPKGIVLLNEGYSKFLMLDIDISPNV